MKFPTEKSKVLALAHTVNTGLAANPTAFPDPPMKTDNMDILLTNYDAKRAEITAAEAHLRQLYQDEEAIFEDINDGTVQNIRFGESIANGDAAKLAMFGWGNPSPRQPLVAPGQCRALEIVGQGDAWVQIDWKEPGDGGKVASYVVERSEDGGEFTQAKTETASESILLNQPTGKKLAYRVVAMNRAGEGIPSNTVALVL